MPPCRVFFDSCDGFFTNYNWQEEHLERMRGQAGERLADVYVGVDVFARGQVVGGRFDTNKVGGGRGLGCRAVVYAPSLRPRLWAFHSRLTSRERQLAVILSRRGKPRHQETSVTCPEAELFFEVLFLWSYGTVYRGASAPVPTAASSTFHTEYWEGR